MRVLISRAGQEWQLIPETDEERQILATAATCGAWPASFYAESESAVYGITDKRDDGRVTVGKHGEEPRMVISIF